MITIQQAAAQSGEDLLAPWLLLIPAAEPGIGANFDSDKRLRCGLGETTILRSYL